MFAKLLHLGGEGLQLAAGGALTLFGVSPKVAVGAWAVGKLLSVFGVRLALPDLPIK